MNPTRPRTRTRALAGLLSAGALAMAGCSTSAASSNSSSGKVPLVEAAATTVYITHDQAEAFALADQVGVLEHGRLVQLGPPEEIYTRPASPFVARFTGLSGELPVRIRGAGPDGTVEVEPAGAGWVRPLRARAPGAGLAGAALLMIRPTG